MCVFVWGRGGQREIKCCYSYTMHGLLYSILYCIHHIYSRVVCTAGSPLKETEWLSTGHKSSDSICTAEYLDLLDTSTICCFHFLFFFVKRMDQRLYTPLVFWHAAASLIMSFVFFFLLQRKRTKQKTARAVQPKSAHPSALCSSSRSTTAAIKN